MNNLANQLSSCSSSRITVDSNYAKAEVEELLTMLRESEHIEEQGDILQYLIDTKGQNYDTGDLEIMFDFSKSSNSPNKQELMKRFSHFQRRN